MQKNNLITILVFLLIGSNLVFSLLLYSKKKSTPAVAMVFNGKEASYSSMENAEVASFWNNYPYLVLASEGRKINEDITLTNAQNPALASVSGNMVYRYFPGDRYFRTDTVLQILKKYEKVILVTDSQSHHSLSKYVQSYGLGNKVYLLSKKINLDCEKVKKPYFFILSKDNRPLTIYFPRREVIEVTEKYLQSNIPRARFF